MVCMNPALAMSIITFSMGYHDDNKEYACAIWVYMMFPLLGVLFAVLLFKKTETTLLKINKL